MALTAGNDIQLPAGNQQKAPTVAAPGVTFPAGANIDGSKLISENKKYDI